jgi:pyruvate,orthophosphate dikinase
MPKPRRRADRAEFGAEGIGLCRTEHMFFDGDRIAAVREMILADDQAGRRGKALDKLLPMQRGDFAEIFRIMAGLPVHDPPARSAAARIPAAHGRGWKPWPGHRPARRAAAASAPPNCTNQPDAGPSRLPLAITYPEIYEMQARAIFEAQVVEKGNRASPVAEVMIPLVGTRQGAGILKAVRSKPSAQGGEETGVAHPLSGRHHDRAAARRPARRRDRRSPSSSPSAPTT